MAFTNAQNLFALFFAIYFALIIDRSHETYKPWDTYSAWRGKPQNVRRLLAGWVILFIIPVLHFSALLALLGSVNVSFDLTVRGILSLVLVSLGSFFDFGYYRIYEAFLHGYTGSFFTEEEQAQIIPPGRTRPLFRAHFIPGVLYVIVSTIMILITIFLLT